MSSLGDMSALFSAENPAAHLLALDVHKTLDAGTAVKMPHGRKPS